MTDHESNNDETRTHVVLINGTMVHHYRIVDKIGAGGMGEVYLAEDTKLKRKVALKFLPNHLVNNDEIRTRFQREAQAVAKLNHPHIVTIHDVSEFNSRPFFVMEHIEGKSLHHSSNKETLSVDSIIELAIQICQGLGEAHRNGIIHRDIKTANIALDSKNRIKLLDFGLAAVSGDSKLTKTGSTLGTIAYMSPEQVSGREADHRSDLFSLGIVLYELLAGRTPFKRDNEGATLKAIIEDNPEPIGRYKANVPEKLSEIIFQLLEKDKELRYQSAEGVVADLKKLMYDSQQSSFSQIKNKEKSFKGLYLIMAAIAACLVIVIGYMAYDKQPEQVVEKNPVLIVLPFENLGSDKDEYFSEGIREEISSKLSAVDGLLTISPRTADKYKDTKKSIQEIGLESGADFVLEGTIRWDKSGDLDRIRIIPRLTKTSDNYLMWSNVYEKMLDHIFEVQSSIADQIVNSLGLTLLDPTGEAPDDAPTKDMAAYSYYLRGLDIANRGIYMKDVDLAIEMYDSAIALDPSFALAWAQKSINHTDHFFAYTTKDAFHHKEQARIAVEKAVSLDPDNPTVHIATGNYYNFVKRDYKLALESFSAARSEISSNAVLTESIGVVKMRQGKWDEAIEKFEEAVRLDPLSGQRYFYLASAYVMTRNFELASTYINRALLLDKENVDASYFRMYLNLLQYGDIEKGEKSFSQMVIDVGIEKLLTYELSSATSLGLWRFIYDKIDPKVVIEGFRNSPFEGSIHLIYLGIGQIYDLNGQHDSAIVYYDSSRISLQSLFAQGDVDFHGHCELGLTYALMGIADSAIYYGMSAKELMAVDDCHW